MEPIKLTGWSDFPNALEEIKTKQAARVNENKGRALDAPLFRGLGNSEWNLETTLERSPDVAAGAAYTLLDYYDKISRTQPVIESLLGTSRPDLPELPDFKKTVQAIGRSMRDIKQGIDSNLYSYLIYLRHHGFPSPFLDWTVSPYLAAFFAFDSMASGAEYVSIYSLTPDTSRSHDRESINLFGPYVRTHSRHFLQQSRYSLCSRLELSGMNDNLDYDYIFLPHKDTLEKFSDDYIAVRLDIPANERSHALKVLDTMNVNPYSVYGSEEALVRTVARREMLFDRV